MFKGNNRNSRTRYKICSKLTIKTPQRNQNISDVTIQILDINIYLLKVNRSNTRKRCEICADNPILLFSAGYNLLWHVKNCNTCLLTCPYLGCHFQDWEYPKFELVFPDSKRIKLKYFSWFLYFIRQIKWSF